MHDEPIAFPWQLGGGRQLKTETNITGTLIKNQTQAVAHSLKADGHDASEDGNGRGTPIVPCGVDGGETAFALRSGASHSGDKGDGGMNTTTAIHGLAVRRLTPRECERLQGFPDDWTLIPWRKTTAENCPDGPRYKALGNSMAVPVMAWIGQRIAQVDAIKEAQP